MKEGAEVRAVCRRRKEGGAGAGAPIAATRSIGRSIGM